jgi:CAI-1 autoinducer synthase
MTTLGMLELAAPKDPPLNPALRARIQRDFAPRWEGQWGGKFVLHGPNAVRLDGNDYLSVTGHPDIVSAQVAALTRNTEFVVQSGVFLLAQHPSRAFELEMANWVGK